MRHESQVFTHRKRGMGRIECYYIGSLRTEDYKRC
jgi:hypothetical protein